MSVNRAQLLNAPLNDLSDVDTTGASNGQVLRFNGGNWLPATPSVAWTDVSGRPTAISAFTNDAGYITAAGAPVQSVAGRTGAVVLTKADVGLEAVENTALSTWTGSSSITTIGAITSGTIPAANVSGFSEAAQDAAASLLTGGTHSGISFSYDDAANTLSATVTSSGFTGGTLTSGLTLAAGTATSSPVRFQSGSVLTTPAVGALEFDGSFFYGTNDATAGRGCMPTIQTYRMTANGANTATTISDYFPANSSINLAGGQVYDFVFVAYLQKNTAGALTWTLAASSAPTLITASYVGSPVTGIAAGTPIQGYTGSRAATTAAFAATASVSNNAFMVFTIRGTIITNAATNLRLRVTNGAGNVTPLAGSYYEVREVSTTVGAFAA